MVPSVSHENGKYTTIPAVCRIRNLETNRTTGTGVLVASGVILTSRSALLPFLANDDGSAPTLVATFFEGSKRKTVDAPLCRDLLCFYAAYPDYLDYCLVACCQDNLFTVAPIELPLTQKEWAVVKEGEVILVVQHIIPRADDLVVSATSADKHGGQTMLSQNVANSEQDNIASYTQQQRFEEILRCVQDLYYLKANGTEQTSGCPAFNELGQLIGLQSQSHADGEGVVNRVVSIITIIQHLFVNQQLYRFSRLRNQSLSFDAIWETWYSKKDLSRIGLILVNFRENDTVRQAFKKMTEIRHNLDCTPECGLLEVILRNICAFREDEALVEMGLRALWKLSAGKDTCSENIIENGGIEMVVRLMRQYSNVSSILQYGVVLLYNTASVLVGQISGHCPTMSDDDSGNFITNVGNTEVIVATASARERYWVHFSDSFGVEAMELILESMRRFPEEMVLQKFSLEFLSILLRCSNRSGTVILHENNINHICHLINQEYRNVFLMEALMGCLGNLADEKHIIALVRESSHSVIRLLNSIIFLTQEHLENKKILKISSDILWALGNNPIYRTSILKNPDGYEVLSRATSVFSTLVG